MAYTDIDKPDDYFQTELWGAVDTSIDTINFAPDWVWIKSRTNADTQILFDRVRGANERLASSETSAEATTSDELTAFNSDGYTLGTGSNVNRSGNNYVSWNWLAGGTGSSNTDGSITSTVSANTTSGFSIVSYTGNATTGATIGHGLGVTPDVIIAKSRASADNWGFFHSSFSSQQYMFLNSTAAVATASSVWNALPGSSVFTVGDNASVNDNGNMIAYCFAEKKGFSKFGSYTGNGSTDGTFVYTGFKPAFVMCKRTDSTGVWFMCDNKRVGFNGRPNNTATRGNPELSANDNRSEAAGNTNVMDIFSNGFKLIQSGGEINGSGASFIFMAFAENPLVTSTGIPATAR